MHVHTLLNEISTVQPYIVKFMFLALLHIKGF